MNKNIVVLGGGIAGIVSALLLKKKNNNVYLLEKNKKLGGLLGSRNLYKNLYFDYGCHFLKQTGIKLIDNIIFPNSKKKKFL